MRAKKWICRNLVMLLVLLTVAPCVACGEPKAIDVLPGAFGEAIDMLDGTIVDMCIKHADLALSALLKDFEQYMEEASQNGYLQVLQTTLLLPGSLPSDATDTDLAIWTELYDGAACVVSFVMIDNSMNLGDVTYAEFSGRFGDYVVRQDGSVQRVSLRSIHSRFFADPIIPGVRVINMGSHCNGIFTYVYEKALGYQSPKEAGPVLQFAVYPTSTYYESYYFTLSQDGVLTCAVGLRESDDISQLNFLTEVHQSAEALLSASNFQRLIRLADELEASSYSSEKQIVFDGWDVALLYNGNVYEMNYWGNNDSEEFTNLVLMIIEVSPIPVDLHGWA